MGQVVTAATGRDYIRTYLGLMGSGKTTQALRDVAAHKRVLIYSPGTTNRALLAYPYVYDTPPYVARLREFTRLHPRLRVEKRTYPSPMFRHLAQMRNYAIVLDDVAALKATPEERADFEAFIRTVRYNNNQVILTTHRARKDLPPLIHVIGTSFFYVGPGTGNRRELEALYELVNYPITFDDFEQRIQSNPARTDTAPAGVFTIRRPN